MARVNGGEITVHEIGFLLDHPTSASTPLAGAPPANGHAALDQLIDQELLVQAAVAHGLDRDPDVLAATEAARRAVLARAYLDHAVAAPDPPERAAVHAYYQDHPALFGQRRIYTMRELRIFIEAGDPVTEGRLKAAWSARRDWVSLVSYLRAHGVRYTIGELVVAAEQLPLSSVDEYQRLSEGEARFARRDDVLTVRQVLRIVHQPINEVRATPMIEAYLRARRRESDQRAELARLKKMAQIERVGAYAQAADEH